MRKGKLITSLALLALIVGFAISAAPTVQAADGPIFIEEMVEMRDGIRLYTRIYLPGPARARAHALFLIPTKTNGETTTRYTTQ